MVVCECLLCIYTIYIFICLYMCVYVLTGCLFCFAACYANVKINEQQQVKDEANVSQQKRQTLSWGNYAQPHFTAILRRTLHNAKQLNTKINGGCCSAVSE